MPWWSLCEPQRGHVMKRFIAFSALGSLLAAPLAYGGPPRWAPPGHRGPPPPAYGHYYPPYSHHRHKGGGDSDEVAWAIGGLVLGAIVGTAVARAERREAVTSGPEPASTPLPPPQR